MLFFKLKNTNPHAKFWRGEPRGFSLPEVIVTLAIITILSVIVLANYRAAEKRYVLQNAVQRLTLDLRKGQNMALAPMVSLGYQSGIGIVFNLDNPSYYFFFEDKNGDKKFNEQAGDRKTEVVQLPDRIKIKEIRPGSKIDIFFEPPDPTIYINGDVGVSASIALGIEGGADTKIISIKTTGLIE